MSLSIFFYDGYFENESEISLDEETARHVVQVLRMRNGAQILLTNGKGLSGTAIITHAEKKKLTVTISGVEIHPLPPYKLHLCVAFTKNSNRNEWLLEKATELGVTSIVPVIASRTERERVRLDRCENIIKSAMIQSKQFHLPRLFPATELSGILHRFNETEQKLIGHCIPTENRLPLNSAMQKGKDTVVLIGPEGDFTPGEVKYCTEAGFTAVTLVQQRLRTETAAMSICAFFNLLNYEN